MNQALKISRQILLTMLLLLAAAWTSGEAAQWLLRWRAEKLLADIASLHATQSTWSDAQPIMRRWSRYSTPTGSCTAGACDYRISLIQTLPPLLVGRPEEGAHNLIPRLVDHVGLRSAATRAGFTVENGVIISRWFGEQVTLPVKQWTLPSNYIPYLSIAAIETAHFHDHAKRQTLLHPERLVVAYRQDLEVSFSPQEDTAEQSALMNFQFSCITQLAPCTSGRDILPEAWNMLQEQELSLRSR